MTNKTKNAFTLTSLILTIVALGVPAFVAILSLLSADISLAFELMGGSSLYFLGSFFVTFYSIYGNILLIVAGAFMGTVLITDKKVAHGVCLIIFNLFSLGIWGLVMTIKTRNKLETNTNKQSNFKQQTYTSNSKGSAKTKQSTRGFKEKQLSSTITHEYYEVLNVTKAATSDEIKKAYKTQVKLFHPDVNSSDDAPAKFLEINKAFNVLNDVHKRATYDRLGHKEFLQRY